ncbi:hypothetical protein SLA2020_403080 [Shorea laevis]
MPQKQRVLKKWLWDCNADVVCLIETHVQQHKFDKIAEYLLPGWHRFGNYPHATLGKIWILWRDHIQIQIFKVNYQAVHCHILNTLTRKYIFTSFIYADNVEASRTTLWDELVLIGNSLPEVPWLLGGDFNEIRYPTESSNQHFPKESAKFHETLNGIELFDLPALGPQFTWTNKRAEGLVARKLDRLLGNSCWLETFPFARAEFLPPDFSDHCAGSVFIPTQNDDSSSSRKPFKFFNFWAKDKDFLNIVREVWEQTEVRGCFMFQLCKKLKALKAPLRRLNKEKYGDLHDRVQKEIAKLHAIQTDLLTSPHEDLAMIEQEQARKVADLTLAEEAFLKQKSRVHWLKEGDQNTSYFHKVLKVKRGKSKIRELQTMDGRRISQPREIATEATQFYQSLLGAEDSNCNGGDVSYLKDLLSFQLPSQVQEKLIQPVSARECKAAFLHSPNNKSPGLDGYTAEFYKAAWPIIGPLVTKAVQEFFITGKLLKQVNATIISFVPKVACPSKMTEFRPISCCNLLYKCITKIIANRLKKCLPLFISSNQCAFIEGRLMVENVLLAQEVVKHYHKENQKPRCALKVDLMKAFDSINWSFLLKILEALAFPIVFIS